MIRLVDPPREPAGPRVTLAVEPDVDRTREFLRELIAAARAWDEARKSRGEAA